MQPAGEEEVEQHRRSLWVVGEGDGAEAEKEPDLTHNVVLE